MMCGAFLFTSRDMALTNIKIPWEVRGHGILNQGHALVNCRVRWLKELPESVVRVPGLLVDSVPGLPCVAGSGES